MPGKNTGKKVTVTTPQGTTVTGDSRGDAGKYAAAKARKRAGEKSGDSPQKKGYMKGYTYSKPAEKLGYIQKFGAERMSPGKMGDMTAAKMLHGDAAAKYYDGVGKYMNGAAKYEGAAKYGKLNDDGGKKKNTSGIFGGDTIMGDENNDGNMLTRALDKFKAGTRRSDEQAGRAASYQKDINKRFVQDIKDEGLLTAIKKNFKF